MAIDRMKQIEFQFEIPPQIILDFYVRPSPFQDADQSWIWEKLGDKKFTSLYIENPIYIHVRSV